MCMRKMICSVERQAESHTFDAPYWHRALVKTCTYAITGLGSVGRIYTHVATFSLTPAGIVARITVGRLQRQELQHLSGWEISGEEDAKMKHRAEIEETGREERQDRGGQL